METTISENHSASLFLRNMESTTLENHSSSIQPRNMESIILENNSTSIFPRSMESITFENHSASVLSRDMETIPSKNCSASILLRNTESTTSETNLASILPRNLETTSTENYSASFLLRNIEPVPSENYSASAILSKNMESTASDNHSASVLSRNMGPTPSEAHSAPIILMEPSSDPISSCSISSEVSQRLSLVRELLSPEVLQQASSRASGLCRVTSVTIRPAADSITGFLGDHFRANVTVELPKGDQRTLRLFVKTSSLINGEKAAFIEQGNFFQRERLLFSLFEELGGGDADGLAGWHVEALYHSPQVLIMSDASADGYSTRPVSQPFDFNHLMVGVKAMARYHAAMTNYSVRKGVTGQPYDITVDYGDILSEPNFRDCPWLRTAARLDADLVQTFSTRHNHIPNLRDYFERLFIQACDSLRPYSNTLNVLIHKDGWANNILFRYDKGVPMHALLIDYQCVRYAPPAFDLMIYIYLNTTNETRTRFEQEIIECYYKEFVDNLEVGSKEWLLKIDYDLRSLLAWCSQARMFGMVAALSIFPYTLMDGVAARQFDDPATFARLCDQDRGPEVIRYARSHHHYRDTQLQAAEEFIQRYLEAKESLN